MGSLSEAPPAPAPSLALRIWPRSKASTAAWGREASQLMHDKRTYNSSTHCSRDTKNENRHRNPQARPSQRSNAAKKKSKKKQKTPETRQRTYNSLYRCIFHHKSAIEAVLYVRCAHRGGKHKRKKKKEKK